MRIDLAGWRGRTSTSREPGGADLRCRDFARRVNSLVKGRRDIEDVQMRRMQRRWWSAPSSRSARQFTRAAVRCKDACSPASCFYAGQWELDIPGLILFFSPVASSLRVFCSSRSGCCGAFLRWAHELRSASFTIQQRP